MEGTSRACVVCGNGRFAHEYKLREMLLGLREEFWYDECSSCGSLQIRELPASMDKYYPPSYGIITVKSDVPGLLSEASRFWGAISHRMGLKGRNPMARLVERTYPELAPIVHAKRLEATPGSRILDVGCGSGGYLRALKALGFQNLTGIDPFIDPSVRVRGIEFQKKEISELSGEYDIILFNQTLEHIPLPSTAMRAANRLLRIGGRCMVRLPVYPSYCWEKYGTDWAQLDPPRHLFIPSVRGLKMLAEDCGFRKYFMEFDSIDFGFWASAQYSMDVPLLSEKSYATHPERGLFSKETIASFREMAKKANQEGKGDQAALYLEKTE